MLQTQCILLLYGFNEVLRSYNHINIREDLLVLTSMPVVVPQSMTVTCVITTHTQSVSDLLSPGWKSH